MSTMITAVLWGMTAIGAAVAAWGLFWDRSRGRKRCGRCWYDMGAVVGYRCPECGKDAKRERGLRRTRRRWRWAVLGVVVGTLGYSGATGGTVAAVRKHGWAAGLPEFVLVRCLVSAWEEKGRTGLHWASEEMRRRVLAGEMSEAGAAEAWERQGVMRTVDVWPEGWRVLVAGKTPAWATNLWGDKSNPSGILRNPAEGSGILRAMGADADGFAVSMETFPPELSGADWVLPFDVAMTGMTHVEARSACEVHGMKSTVVVSVRLPIRVVEAPVHARSAGLDARVAKAMRWEVTSRGDANSGPMIWCQVDWDLLPELAFGGIYASVDLEHGFENIPLGFMSAAPGTTEEAARSYVVLPRGRPIPDDGWSLRVKAVPRPTARYRWPTGAYWVGEIEVRGEDVTRKELR